MPDGASVRRVRSLQVGGLTPLSATDYPGHLSAVVFCQGCPWRCGYCHNPHLLPSLAQTYLAWESVLAFLRRRRGLLDAVVFSGGEPTAQPGLADSVREAKALGFRVGLHTGGPYPTRLAALLPLLDWVGMDIKAPFSDYAAITKVANSGARALASARAVIASGIEHEFRTTVHPDQLSPGALTRLAQDLSALGAKRYVLQEFRAQGCADERLVARPSQSFLDHAFCANMTLLFGTFSVRRA